uniref:Protein kinase domain-containing protein n=1 Tax=Aegilops tauschii subsp. strangulata TaxID=200361 RepID=A0A453QYB6_AEGTS
TANLLVWNRWQVRKLYLEISYITLVHIMERFEDMIREFIKSNERAKRRPVNNHGINNFTEDEIKMITKNYKNPIGKGAFGEVYRGVLDDGSTVAVKKYICQNLKDGFAKEITVHCRIDHKNVVRLLGYCLEENALMIVTEYIPGGNLKDLLHGSDDHISLDARLGIAIECAEALTCMHSLHQPIIHGDIKPDNILLDENLGAKLSDFGISRLLCMDETAYTMHVAGSRGYMDPELFETGRVDPRNDVYSFGVVMVELVTRAKVNENGMSTGVTRNFTQAIEKGKTARAMFDTKIANVSNMKVLDNIGKLAAECLRRDIKKRPEMKDVTERLRALRKAYCQQDQEKTGRWSMKNVNRKGQSISASSNSTMYYKLNNLGMFSTWNAPRNFMRNAGPIVEQMQNLRVFTREEIRKITNGYSSDVIAKCSSCEVYKGTLEDNTLVAVNIETAVDEAHSESFTNSMLIYSIILHNNIIKLLGCYLEADVPILVYEFAANGNLQDILRGNYSFPLGIRLDIAVGCAEALAYLHSRSFAFVGANVTSANILLDDSLVPKVSGPLFICHSISSTSGDVYSFGILLLELITRKQGGYRNNSPQELRKAYMKKGHTMFDKEIAAKADILILERIQMVAMDCLKLDALARPKMAEVAERLQRLKNVESTGSELRELSMLRRLVASSISKARENTTPAT